PPARRSHRHTRVRAVFPQRDTCERMRRCGRTRGEDGLGCAIIGVSVGMPANEIVFRVVGRRIKLLRLGAPQPARDATQNIASILAVEILMLRDQAASWTGKLSQLLRQEDSHHQISCPGRGGFQADSACFYCQLACPESLHMSARGTRWFAG